jgi:hypothetical protein
MLLKKQQKYYSTYEWVHSVPLQEFFRMFLQLYRLYPLGPDCHPYQREHSCRGVNEHNKMQEQDQGDSGKWIWVYETIGTFLNHDHTEQSCHRWCDITLARDIRSMVPENSHYTHRAAWIWQTPKNKVSKSLYWKNLEWSHWAILKWRQGN